MPVGKGHVVMFAANPMWRHQTQGVYVVQRGAELDNLELEGLNRLLGRNRQPATDQDDRGVSRSGHA